VSAVTLTLPIAPSVNSAYLPIVKRGRSRLMLSTDGRRYKETVKGIAWREGVKPFGAHVRLELAMVIHFPDKRRRDISNQVKVCEDSLKWLVFEDDEQIDRLVVERGSVDRGNPRIEVTVTPLSETRAAA
jgi:crossover junction endodeoxyribonuclease RusA